jgi:phosphomannomutase
MSISKSIFQAYDIRGIVEQELTPEAVKLIGLAIGSESDPVIIICITKTNRQHNGQKIPKR